MSATTCPHEYPAGEACPACGIVPVCSWCGGDGWYVGHEDDCYENGDCDCSGVQVGCEQCQGTGGAS